MWFAEGINNIGRVTPDGVITEFPGPSASASPEWITADADGNLWFTGPVVDKVDRMTPTGVGTAFDVEGGPLGPITTGPDGNLWFSDSQNIVQMTTAGIATYFPFGGLTDGPTSCPDGNLWLVANLTIR